MQWSLREMFSKIFVSEFSWKEEQMNVKFMWPPKRRPQQSWTLCEFCDILDWEFLRGPVCECILFGVTLLRDANHWTTTTIKTKRIENGWWTARRKELMMKTDETENYWFQRAARSEWVRIRMNLERTEKIHRENIHLSFCGSFGFFWFVDFATGLNKMN